MAKDFEKLFSLENKVVAITGAGGLLGREHAHSIAMAGGIPILLDVDFKRVEELKEEIQEQYSVKVRAFKVDITNEKDVENNVKTLIKEFGKIDAIINNAANNPKMGNTSSASFSRLETFSQRQWLSDISVGLTGAFIASKHYGKKISENSKGGVILNISSDLGVIAPNQSLYKIDDTDEDKQPVKPVSYSVVKFGLIGLTKYLSTYWPDKVRCNALAPGGVKNEQSEKFLKKIQNLIPQSRMAEKDEYQGAIIFLLSDASKYMNGTILQVDGGRTAW